MSYKSLISQINLFEKKEFILQTTNIESLQVIKFIKERISFKINEIILFGHIQTCNMRVLLEKNCKLFNYSTNELFNK